MPKIFGSSSGQLPEPNRVGSLAYQDSKTVSIDGGAITGTTNIVGGGFFQDTDISEVRPSVTIDFVNSKTIDNKFSFNRPTSEWQDTDGLAVIGAGSYYDGKTNEIYEENVAWYSEIPYHTNQLTTTLQSTLAPDGVSWAYLVTETTTTDYHGMYRGNYYDDRLSRQPVYTSSIYAKLAPSGRDFLGIVLVYTTNQYISVKFNINAGTIVLRRERGPGRLLDATITSVGNGWYRCSVSGFRAAQHNVQSYYFLSSDATTLDINSDGLHRYAGDNTKGMYWWGSQVEMRDRVGEYVPTHHYGISKSVPCLVKTADNTPRFDHNPVTGESLGLLIEDTAINLIKNSKPNPSASIFSTYWQVSNATSRSQTRGRIDGSIIVPNSSYSSVSPWSQNIACLLNLQLGVVDNTSANYRWSFYINPLTWTGDIRFAVVSGDGNSSFGTNIHLFSNGQYVGDSTYVKYVLPDGTYVLKDIPNTYNAGASLRPIWYTTITGNGWKKWWVSAIQYQSGSNSTSFIETYSKEVRLRSDLLFCAQNNFLKWFNNETGTCVIEFNTYTSTFVRNMFILEMGSSGYYNQIQVYLTSSNSIVLYAAGSGNAESLTIGTPNSTLASGTAYNGSRIRIALKYSTQQGLAISVNGQTVRYLTTPIMRYNSMFLGALGDWTWPNASGTIQGWLRDFVYFPTALSDAELQEISML